MNLGSRSFTRIIPSDSGPKASVRVSNETVSGGVSWYYIPVQNLNDPNWVYRL